MNTHQSQKAEAQNEVELENQFCIPKMPKVLHTLSNKLLPIVAFSDLGSRCCEDPKLREYFEKIRLAAADSRELIIQLRQEFQQSRDNSSVKVQSSDDEVIGR